MSILIVDDSLDNRTLLNAILNSAEYAEMLAAESACGAFGHLGIGERANGETKVDLILMHMQMPVMDGHTATKAIRAWEHENRVTPTPIIALTAYALKDEAEKFLAVGCTAHVSKPVRKATVLEIVQEDT